MSDTYVPGQHTPLVSAGEIYDALIEARGNIAEAARNLGMARGKLKDSIDRNVELVALLDDLREGMVDKAEQNIYTDVEKGDGAASRFLLQTIGRERGYMTGVAGTGKNGEIVVQINKLAQDASE